MKPKALSSSTEASGSSVISRAGSTLATAVRKPWRSVTAKSPASGASAFWTRTETKWRPPPARVSVSHGKSLIRILWKSSRDAGEAGKFVFALRGLEDGETTIRLQIAHEGHVDFTTVPLPVHVGEEFEAEGLVIIESGVRFFRYFQGEIDSGDGRVSELTAPIGMTPHWRIMFLDEHGDEIDPPDDPEFTFGWTIADTDVVEVVQDEGDEGSFEFHLRGLHEGETTIVLKVDHDGHTDFSTQPIPVHVESQEGQHGEPAGLRLKEEDSGEVLVEAPVAGEGTASDALSVAVGDTTDHIATFFFDEDDVEFQPEAPDHTLGIAVADTSLLAIDPPAAPEYWAFRLIGKKAGTTTITLSILHDGEEEEEFAPISVAITAQ